MAYIQQRGERKYKITVCNGYKPNGQKTRYLRVTVTREVSKRGHSAIRYGRGGTPGKTVPHWHRSEREHPVRGLRQPLAGTNGQTLQSQYTGGLPPDAGSDVSNHWRLAVMQDPPNGAGGTLRGNCVSVPGRNGKTMSENTVHKYLDTVSAVLQDAVKNDILLYNPAPPRGQTACGTHAPAYPAGVGNAEVAEMHFAGTTALPVYYLLALSTGLRRGELCALRWQDLHGGNQLLIHHSRSTVVGKGVIESDTKSHRTRVVVIPQLVYDYLGELLFNQIVENNGHSPR